MVIVGIVGEQHEGKIIVLSRQTEKLYIYETVEWIMEWNQELMLIFSRKPETKQLFYL